jgi:cytochrome c-type biogenesis protein CcmH/NrfG
MAQSSVATDVKQQFLDLTVSEMQAQEAVSPLDARFPLFLGTVYDAYSDFKDAQTALEKAHELSPDKQTIYFELGQNAWAQDDDAQALQYFKTAYDLAPAFQDAQVYYAAAAIRSGEESLADSLIQPLMSANAAADPKILAAYIARGEIAKAIPIWEAYVTATPDDAQGYFTLAAIYYQAGQSAQAIATLQRAEKAIPAVATQADPLIQQIQNGTVQIGQ